MVISKEYVSDPHSYCHLHSSPHCHRYDFLVRLYRNGLKFSNFLNFILHLGLITTPMFSMFT